MPDFDSIRRGLAANLRAALPAAEGLVSPYLLADPKKPCLQVAGIERMEPHDFGDGRDYTILIEACLALGEGIAAQRKLDELIDSVPAAIESNLTLTSRLLDNGTVQTGQAAACDALAFVEYRGAGKQSIAGTECLLGVWAVQVVT
jgi:hypothetical protein